MFQCSCFALFAIFSYACSIKCVTILQHHICTQKETVCEYITDPKANFSIMESSWRLMSSFTALLDSFTCDHRNICIICIINPSHFQFVCIRNRQCVYVFVELSGIKNNLTAICNAQWAGGLWWKSVLSFFLYCYCVCIYSFYTPLWGPPVYLDVRFFIFFILSAKRITFPAFFQPFSHIHTQFVLSLSTSSCEINASPR